MRRFLVTLALLFTATLAQAAGFRFIEVPADGEGPALKGAMWSPCSEAPGTVDLGNITLPGVKDCAIGGEKLPLVVISHGRGGTFVGHHDIGETLADAGFVAAAINHPGDTVSDLSRSDDLSVFIERPTDIKRLVDFMISASPAASSIDSDRIGFFGFSRGGYTGLVLVGANPDWTRAADLCEQSSSHICDQIRGKEYPTESLTHDPRIKAAVIVDPLALLFTADSLQAIKVPIQLWASELGGDGVTPHMVGAVDSGLPVKHEYHVVPNSGHFAFLAPCLPHWPRPVQRSARMRRASTAAHSTISWMWMYWRFSVRNSAIDKFQAAPTPRDRCLAGGFKCTI
jgi:predicted dienelactone hydrolase